MSQFVKIKAEYLGDTIINIDQICTLSKDTSNNNAIRIKFPDGFIVVQKPNMTPIFDAIGMTL